MKRHAIRCFGETLVTESMTSNAENVRKGLAKHKDGSIVEAFEARGNGVVTYSTRPLSKIEVR